MVLVSPRVCALVQVIDADSFELASFSVDSAKYVSSVLLDANSGFPFFLRYRNCLFWHTFCNHAPSNVPSFIKHIIITTVAAAISITVLHQHHVGRAVACRGKVMWCSQLCTERSPSCPPR